MSASSPSRTTLLAQVCVCVFVRVCVCACACVFVLSPHLSPSQTRLLSFSTPSTFLCLPLQISFRVLHYQPSLAFPLKKRTSDLIRTSTSPPAFKHNGKVLVFSSQLSP